MDWVDAGAPEHGPQDAVYGTVPCVGELGLFTEAKMAFEATSVRGRVDSRKSTLRGRDPERRTAVDLATTDLSEIRGPRWTDLFYLAVAFGTASAIFWMAGF